MEQRNVCKDFLFGIVIGDALGVPVEFENRQFLKQNPVTDFIGHGTYNQPVGTFSDDSSLTFCLAECLLDRFDLNIIAQSFLAWYYKGYWTAHGVAFDIGATTVDALSRLKRGVAPELAGGDQISDNGNGALMRILPLLLFIKDLPLKERYSFTKQVASITHRHHYSIISCFYYLEFARLLLTEPDGKVVYSTLQTTFRESLLELGFEPKDCEVLTRLLDANIAELEENEIQSSGFVIYTLEASIWCLLTSTTYKETVLKAVNLGSDTDTTAAVAGGLAGIIYGFDAIPESWVRQLARKEDIAELAKLLGVKYL